MAVPQQASTAARFNIFPVILRWLNTAGEALASTSAAMACAREAERLMQLSDEELAARGLTRDQIARHVFGRHITM
jgi:hypothetical protein